MKNINIKFIWTVCDVISESLGECAIYRCSENGGLFQIAYRNKLYGFNKTASHHIRVPLMLPNYQGIVGRSARLLKKQIVDDTFNDADYIKDGLFRRSECCVPIENNGKSEYIIDVEHHDTKFFQEDKNFKLIEQCASILQFGVFGKNNAEYLETKKDWDSFIALGELARNNTLNNFGRDCFLHIWKQQLGINFIN